MADLSYPSGTTEGSVAIGHVLYRTSPRGTAFRGRCRLCSAEGLKAEQATEPCPNPRGVSIELAVAMAFQGTEP